MVTLDWRSLVKPRRAVRWILALLGSSAAWALACSDATSPPLCPTVANPITAVAVTPSTGMLAAIGDSVQLVAQAKDARGTVCSGTTFAWASTDTAVVTVSATGLARAITNGSATISATTSGVTGNAPVSVVQRVASVSVTPGNPMIAVGDTQVFAAIARDARNHPVPGVTYTWASADAGVAPVNQGGRAVGMAIGTTTISATSEGIAGSTALTVTTTPPTQLAFLLQPSGAPAGTAISPAVQVEVRDAAGARVNTASTTVTLAIGTNPNTGTLAGTATVDAVNGVATFPGLAIDKVGTGYTLVASAGSLTAATSAPFNISPGAAARVAIIVQPTNAVAGAAFSPAIEVEVRDAGGARVTTANNAVTLTIGTNSGNGTLLGTTTVSAVNGVATFSSVSLDKAGTGYTLRATAGSLANDSSAGFNITPGAASRVTFVTQPDSVVEGNSVFGTVVHVTDDYGNRVAGTTNDVTLTLVRTAPLAANAQFSASSTFAVDGVATWTDLKVDLAGAGYTLAASRRTRAAPSGSS
jgi:hypothetical protein